MKKNKNIIGGIIIIGLILFGFLLIASPASQRNTASVSGLLSKGGLTALSASEKSYDFGIVSMASGKVSHIFNIRNSGTEPLTIEKLYTSCMCTVASLVKSGKKIGPFGMPGHGFMPRIGEVLAAGEEAEIEAVFDPAAHGPAGIGRIERVIYAETNDAAAPFEVGFSATVTP